MKKKKGEKKKKKTYINVSKTALGHLSHGIIRIDSPGTARCLKSMRFMPGQETTVLFRLGCFDQVPDV